MSKKDWIIMLETVTLLFLIIHSTIYIIIAKDLSKEVDTYKSLYKEESTYVRILQENCLKEGESIYD